jgi:hypothetical protein
MHELLCLNCVSIGSGLNLDTPEKIQRIKIDVGAEVPANEQPIKNGRNFKRGEILLDESYTAT